MFGGVRATDYSRGIGHTLGLSRADSSRDLGFIFICSGLSSFHVNKEKITEPAKSSTEISVKHGSDLNMLQRRGCLAEANIFRLSLADFVFKLRILCSRKVFRRKPSCRGWKRRISDASSHISLRKFNFFSFSCAAQTDERIQFVNETDTSSAYLSRASRRSS
jgi:hypothetical protein